MDSDSSTRRAHRDLGFTLVEIVVAIVLVGVLSAVVVVGVGQLTSKGTSAACSASADAARAASTAYYASNLAFPTTFAQLTDASLMSPPAGATVAGATMSVGGSGGWTLTLVPGSGSGSPTFSCSTSGATTTAGATTTVGTPTTASATTVPTGSPPVTGAILWLDASQPATITLTGSNVTRWADRSGGGADATATGTTGPTVVTVGGRTYLSFNGTNQQLALTLAGSKSTIISVVRSTSTTWGSYGSVLENRSGGRLGNIFEHGATNFHFNPYPTSVRKNGASVPNSFNLVPVNQFMVLTVVPSAPTASNQLGIGALENNWYSPIQLGELIVYPRTLTPTELQSVEQYLAAKWGVT